MKRLTTLLTATALVGSLGMATLVPAALADNERGWRGGEHGQMQMRDGEGRGERGRMGRGQGGGFLGVACDAEGAERMAGVLGALEQRLALTDAQKPLFDDLRTTALDAQTTFADNCPTPPAGARGAGMAQGPRDGSGPGNGPRDGSGAGVAQGPRDGSGPGNGPRDGSGAGMGQGPRDGSGAGMGQGPRDGSGPGAMAQGERPDLMEMLEMRHTMMANRLTALDAVMPKFEALYNSLTDEQKAKLTPPRGMMGEERGERGHGMFGKRGMMGHGRDDS